MWGATIERAASTRATARAARSDSLILKVHAHELRGARRPFGGSDPSESTLTVLIVSVILERPTCIICLAAKVGATKLAIVRTLERIGTTLQITVANDERCRACGSTLGPVYSLPR